MSNSAPFPLEGALKRPLAKSLASGIAGPWSGSFERAGDGGGTAQGERQVGAARPVTRLFAPDDPRQGDFLNAADRVSPPSPALPPSKGEGRPAPGSVKRARRLRKEQTLAERILWEALRKQKMNFRRQVPIGQFIADFAHHESKLLIEVDGYYHTVEGAAERDAARTAWLVSEGFRVIRFAEKEVRDDIVKVVELIVAETAP